MKPFADDAPVLHQHGADGRVGAGGAQRLSGQSQGPLHGVMSSMVTQRVRPEVLVGAAGGRLLLALVLAPQAGAPVGPVDGRRQAQERYLADLHAAVDGDGHLRGVRELQRQLARPAGVDVAGGGVDEQPQAPQRAAAVQPRHDVVGQGDRLQRAGEDELARTGGRTACRPRSAPPPCGRSRARARRCGGGRLRRKTRKTRSRRRSTLEGWMQSSASGSMTQPSRRQLLPYRPSLSTTVISP